MIKFRSRLKSTYFIILLNQDDHGDTPFHLALACRLSELSVVISEFIKTNQSIDLLSIKNNDSDSPLHMIAYSKKNLAALIPLLSLDGIDFNIVDNNADTPLHIAVKNKNTEIIKQLIPRTNIKAINAQGQTPFALAQKNTSLRKLFESLSTGGSRRIRRVRLNAAGDRKNLMHFY